MSCIELRDKGSLISPSKITVLLTGLIIKSFEKFLNLEDKLNEHCLSCSSSRVALKSLKEIIYEIIFKSCIFNVFKGKC